MPDASIAVLVPVFNRRRSVLEALDSVAAQSLPPTRLVVVDDGSSDGSADGVARWMARPRPFSTELLRQENRGVSAARNRALRAAGNCKLVAFLDSDDLWPPDFLARLSAALHTRPRAVAATCNRLRQDLSQGTCREEDLSALQTDATRWLFLHDGGIASASLFRTHQIHRLGGFPEHWRTAEDLSLFFRLSLWGPWLHVAGLNVTFRQGLAEQRGEAGNLSLHYGDKFRRTAEVYEEFVLQHGGSQILPRPLVRRVLSRWWYLAGRELWRAGRIDEARDCYRRSTTWRTCNKAWLRWGQTYLPRAA